MALIATSFTMEVILLIIGLYLYDGGVIRKFGAVGLFITDLQLTYKTQGYVSDLTSSPQNVNLFFTPAIQQAWAIMLAILTLTTLAWTFVSLARIIKWMQDTENPLTMTMILEELV